MQTYNYKTVSHIKRERNILSLKFALAFIYFKYNASTDSKRLHSTNNKTFRIRKIKLVRDLFTITFTNNCWLITNWTVSRTDWAQSRTPITSTYKRRISHISVIKTGSNSLDVLSICSSAPTKIILSRLSKRLNKDWLKLLTLDTSSLRKAPSSLFISRKVWTFLETSFKELAEALTQG